MQMSRHAAGMQHFQNSATSFTVPSALRGGPTRMQLNCLWYTQELHGDIEVQTPMHGGNVKQRAANGQSCLLWKLPTEQKEKPKWETWQLQD